MINNIGDEPFLNCIGLIVIDLSSVNSIGDNVFDNCDYLRKIIFKQYSIDNFNWLCDIWFRNIYNLTLVAGNKNVKKKMNISRFKDFSNQNHNLH